MSLSEMSKESLITTEGWITTEQHGLRVDVALAQLFPDYSRSQLSHWLKEGDITLDKRVMKPKDKVFGGEHVAIHVALDILENRNDPEDMPLDILFEDNHVLVLNKPAGMVVHPGAGNARHTLVNALLFHDPSLQQLPRAGIVHRLDKETTGLLMVAKTLESLTYLTRQMQARDVQRHYVALVQGHLIAGGTIDTCYGRHPRNRLKMAVCTQGKQAITHYSVREHYHCATLVDVTLMTGRTHQIRVHMAHINHPVVGDPLYAGPPRIPAGTHTSVRQAIQQFDRQALHACSLSFIHPETQERLTFEAPMPQDFETLLSTLDEHGFSYE